MQIQLSPTAQSLLIVLATGLGATAAAPSAAAAQWWPVIHTETDIGEVGRFRIGMSAGAILPSGKAFDQIRNAPSLQLFAALPIEPFDDVRIGIGRSRHHDDLDGNDVDVTMVFVEPLFAFGEGSQRLSIGPRVIYAHQARDLFRNRMHGIGLGAMVSLAQSIGPRLAIEVSASLSSTTMPGTDIRNGPDDPVGWSNAWFRELRVGLTARP